MTRSILLAVLLTITCVCRAAVLQGSLQWTEDDSLVTRVATFSFDTFLQSGRISNFWTNEEGTFIDDDYPYDGKRGWLADGDYCFSVSTTVSSYSELIDFGQVVWLISEERVISEKVEEVLGTLSDGRYEIVHWIYLMNAGPTWNAGSYSVIPEPASLLLFCLGAAGLPALRRIYQQGRSDAS